MKFISSQQGTVVYEAQTDDIGPKSGMLQNDLIQFVANRYKFLVKPILPPNVDRIQNLMFRNGKFYDGSDTHIVQQIGELPNADAVTALDTDVAELILADLIRGLEKELGFDYSKAAGTKTYSSTVIVQFDLPLEEKIATFNSIEAILAKAIPRQGAFKPKALSFGFGDPAPMTISGDLRNLLDMDFSLQRRHGALYSENRYTSSMPLPTKEHLKVLKLIEDAL